MRLGLERMGALLEALGRPQAAAPALHVVGTNGKSSTTRLAAAALASQGLRVGAYLSPHVDDWRERIRVAGEAIDEWIFADAATEVRRAGDGLRLPPGEAVTQFEALTAMAFLVFRDEGADAMAVEAGLGGRFDATNVLAPGAAVALTNVDLDHTAFLGDTVAEIAAEKLAVCADGADRLVVGPLSVDARAAVDAECARRGLLPLRYGEGLDAEVAEDGEGVDVVTPRARYHGLRLALRGGFQLGNLAVAMAGAEMVVGGALDVAALGDAVADVRVPGRMELFAGAPAVMLDGAHNPAGMRAMVGALPEVAGGRRPVVAVVSTLEDKESEAMLGVLAPAVDRVIATRSTHRRAVDPEALAGMARAAGGAAEAVADPAAALAAAVARAGPRGLVLVTGSLYLLADLRRRVAAEPESAPARLARARKGSESPEAK